MRSLLMGVVILSICSPLFYACDKTGPDFREPITPGKIDTLPYTPLPPNPPPGNNAQRILMDEFIGANAFVDDPIEKIKAVGFIREYHNWGWDEGNWDAGYQGYPNNHIAWAPSAPGWNFDDFYRTVAAAKVGVAPCLQGAVSWLQGGNDFKYNNKPVDAPGLSTTDANAYHKKAHHLFQFAAHYGATQVAADKLTLAPGQPVVSGLGLIKYIEDWNEQDKDWEGKEAQFSPEEYAAMASADYDGHGNTLTGGKGTFGIKNADPHMKLVMGGLVDINIDYIKRMKAWFETNRADKKFAVDVLNFHIYAWRPDNWIIGPALSPEAARFKERAAEVVEYRNKNLPNAEVWFSEFGWDTHPESPLRPYNTSHNDLQELQGQWLVRAYLAFAAAGVDKAQMFMLRDVNPNDPTWFSTCGLVQQKGDYTPKKSWYYVYTLRHVLTNMYYMEEQASSDAHVLIYKFKDAAKNNGVYVVWAKTNTGYGVANFELPISANATSASSITLTTGSTEGVAQNLVIQSGKVAIQVSEKPVFIKVDNIK